MCKHLLVVSDNQPFAEEPSAANAVNVVLSCVEQAGVKRVVADVCPTWQPVGEAIKNPMARVEFYSFEELLSAVANHGATLVFHESMDSLL